MICLVACASVLRACLSKLPPLGFDIDYDPSYESQQARCTHISGCQSQTNGHNRRYAGEIIHLTRYSALKRMGTRYCKSAARNKGADICVPTPTCSKLQALHHQYILPWWAELVIIRLHILKLRNVCLRSLCAIQLSFGACCVKTWEVAILTWASPGQ